VNPLEAVEFPSEVDHARMMHFLHVDNGHLAGARSGDERRHSLHVFLVVRHGKVSRRIVSRRRDVSLHVDDEQRRRADDQ
jgi:hypothetical protein